MVKFINNIIYCSMTDILIAEKISQEALSASLNEINKEFSLKLYKDNIAITSRT